MLRLPLTSVHVLPPLSELYKPPYSFSISAYTRFGSAPETSTPMRPTTPVGRPGRRVISVHDSPPSVDLKSPEPGPPLSILYSFRYACHSAAYRIIGFVRSTEMSIAPVLSSRYSTLRQVRPPSLLLNTPRSALGAAWNPNAATHTMSGLVGWTRISEMFCLSLKPTFVHVLPASVDL